MGSWSRGGPDHGGHHTGYSWIWNVLLSSKPQRKNKPNHLNKTLEVLWHLQKGLQPWIKDCKRYDSSNCLHSLLNSEILSFYNVSSGPPLHTSLVPFTPLTSQSTTKVICGYLISQCVHSKRAELGFFAQSSSGTSQLLSTQLDNLAVLNSFLKAVTFFISPINIVAVKTSMIIYTYTLQPFPSWYQWSKH